MKLIITFALLALIIFTGGCKNMDKDKITFNLFDHGVKKVVKIDSDANKKEMEKLLTDLTSGTDDMLRLLVDKKSINELKNTESGVEIIFPQKFMLISEKMGSHEVDKLYIPFSGNFVGKDSNTMATIFMANGAYISGPLRNSKGLKMVNRIKEIITQK